MEIMKQIMIYFTNMDAQKPDINLPAMPAMSISRTEMNAMFNDAPTTTNFSDFRKERWIRLRDEYRAILLPLVDMAMNSDCDVASKEMFNFAKIALTFRDDYPFPLRQIEQIECNAIKNGYTSPLEPIARKVFKTIKARIVEMSENRNFDVSKLDDHHPVDRNRINRNIVIEHLQDDVSRRSDTWIAIAGFLIRFIRFAGKQDVGKMTTMQLVDKFVVAVSEFNVSLDSKIEPQPVGDSKPGSGDKKLAHASLNVRMKPVLGD